MSSMERRSLRIENQVLRVEKINGMVLRYVAIRNTEIRTEQTENELLDIEEYFATLKTWEIKSVYQRINYLMKLSELEKALQVF